MPTVSEACTRLYYYHYHRACSLESLSSCVVLKADAGDQEWADDSCNRLHEKCHLRVAIRISRKRNSRKCGSLAVTVATEPEVSCWFKVLTNARQNCPAELALGIGTGHQPHEVENQGSDMGSACGVATGNFERTG